MRIPCYLSNAELNITTSDRGFLFGTGKNNCFFPPLTGTFPLIERIMFVCIR